MGDWLKPGTAEDLLVDEVAGHYLRLRELLVRGDENLKAWHLLNTVPYWARSHDGIRAAWEEQRSMVEHAIDPGAYARYYATNVHEAAFELQYGMEADEAHKHIHRLAFLRSWIGADDRDATFQVLDLSGNDGAFAQNLRYVGAETTVVDLNPDCLARARKRPGVAGVIRANLLDLPDDVPQDFDAVVLLEVIEHLIDPAEGIRVAAKYVGPEGRLFVSTPLAAVERLDLPGWGFVEPKGHLHSITPADFQAMLEAVGDVEALEVGPDRVMVARVVL